jgi:hypothetical protein
MAAPQGIVFFAGVRSFLAANLTRTPGIFPNVCHLRVPPQPGGLPETGPLIWSYGGNTMQLQDCKLDKVDFAYDSSGRETWVLRILDPRWKWHVGGFISGNYNIRRGSGIVNASVRTPKELIRLFLDAMGEERWDTSQVKNDVFPEIELDYTLPAEGLAQLCEALGCQIFPKLNGRYSIEPIRRGAMLPVFGALTNAVTINPPERPDELRFASAPIRIQADIPLEPVAEDTDGEFRPITRLRFAPRGGWSRVDVESMNSVEPPMWRERARRDVFRLFRPIVNSNFGTTPAFGTGPRVRITSLEQILPLDDRQVEQVFRDGELRRKDAILWGTFWRRDAGGYNTFGTDQLRRNGLAQPPVALAGDPRVTVPYGFDIDRTRGLVRVSEALVRKVAGVAVPVGAGRSNPSFSILPPILFLRTSFNVRTPETRGILRAEFSRRSQQKKFGTKPRAIARDDVEAWTFLRPNGQIATNEREVERQANFYLDQEEQRYTVTDSQTADYAGLLPIELDGAVGQVTWAIDDAGYATTTVARHQEDPSKALTYEERQLNVATAALLRRDSRSVTSRSEADRLSRGT